MNSDIETVSMKSIAIVRNLQRSLANQCFERGLSTEDIALASLYSAFDIAEGAKGPGMVAVEWLRTGLDVIEQGILPGGREP